MQKIPLRIQLGESVLSFDADSSSEDTALYSLSLLVGDEPDGWLTNNPD